MPRLDLNEMIFKNRSVDEPEPKRRAKRRRLRVTVTSIVAGGVVLAVVALGTQNHDDKVLTGQMIQTETELKTTGAKIADIKDHRFGSMSDYINAYARVEPLLNNYDHELHQYVDLCNRARLRDEGVPLINIKPRQQRHNSDVCRHATPVIELTGQINTVMKKEASVIRDTSSLPE